MNKYLLKRLLHGTISIVIVVAIVMLLVYSLLNRDLIFAHDTAFTHQNNNSKIAYKYSKWEEYGYIDYLTYNEYLAELRASGELSEEKFNEVSSIGRTPEKDSDGVKEYVTKFTETYEARGYSVSRLNAVVQGKKLADGGRQLLFAYKDIPVTTRLVKYFSGLLTFDNIHRIEDYDGERGLTFTLYDPVYGGSKFSPAVIGSGTTHRYLIYFDSYFPYIHQNLVTLNLGVSYSVNNGVDVSDTMSRTQGAYVTSPTIYPTGLIEDSADDLHSATWITGSREGSKVYADRFTDDYTNVKLNRGGMSKLGYSFVIGIIASIGAYLLGLPLGILMARKKDRLIDQLGTAYIVFISAVPSLAYIFMFKSLGRIMGLPTTFNMDAATVGMYVLPIMSLSLPSIGGLMKWMRRYMIDQMNSDYVKFARSGGLSEREIFSKHIMKNAAVPIVHGIPGSILFAMTGAIITERVYSVPGAGNMLTQAINRYDNGVIIGVTLFYAVLSVLALIMGDILMSLVDPRISFSTKDR